MEKLLSFVLFIQFQEALFKRSGKLEFFIHTGKGNDNNTSVNTLNLTGTECFMQNDGSDMNLRDVNLHGVFFVTGVMDGAGGT